MNPGSFSQEAMAWADYVEWSGLDEARLAEIMGGDERRGP